MTYMCGHCGSSSHDDSNCTVKDATLCILESYRPRGMTVGKPCPSCNEDGKWDWGEGSRSFVCECGNEVPSSWGRDG